MDGSRRARLSRGLWVSAVRADREAARIRSSAAERTPEPALEQPAVGDGLLSSRVACGEQERPLRRRAAFLHGPHVHLEDLDERGPDRRPAAVWARGSGRPADRSAYGAAYGRSGGSDVVFCVVEEASTVLP
ncbi:MAG: hypothetical protein NVS3B26_06010 [Mycobacteriales bacterium]